MTPARTCFDRIAGAYINDMGEVEDSFNVHFGKLSGGEKSKNLALAKAIPFSKTNLIPLLSAVLNLYIVSLLFII